MHLVKSVLTLIVAMFLCSLSIGAPIPATSTSQFIGAERGLYRSIKGFTIHAEKTSWLHKQSPKGSSFVETIYKAPQASDGVQAALTVRTDRMSKKKSLRSYIKRWKKDYPRFGFDILKAQKVKVSGNTGFLIDLINKSSQKQLRQVVFVRGKQAVIMTCRDHKDNFKETVRSCNQIIRNFSWI